MANRMDKWLHHTFSSGCETGSDYDAFQREARADLRKPMVVNDRKAIVCKDLL